jgi:hypothetical protein
VALSSSLRWSWPPPIVAGVIEPSRGSTHTAKFRRWLATACTWADSAAVGPRLRTLNGATNVKPPAPLETSKKGAVGADSSDRPPSQSDVRGIGIWLSPSDLTRVSREFNGNARVVRGGRPRECLGMPASLAFWPSRAIWYRVAETFSLRAVFAYQAGNVLLARLERNGDPRAPGPFPGVSGYAANRAKEAQPSPPPRVAEPYGPSSIFGAQHRRPRIRRPPSATR